MRGPQQDPVQLIRSLDLLPHPEGGHYRETYRAIETVPTPPGPPGGQHRHPVSAGGRGALLLAPHPLR